MNQKLKLIVIDGLILAAVSSVIAILVSLAVSAVKQAAKDDPIVTAIIQGSLKDVRKYAREGEAVTNQRDRFGRTALMRAAFANLSDPPLPGEKELALLDALDRCGVRMPQTAAEPILRDDEKKLVGLLEEQGVKLVAKPGSPLKPAEEVLAKALAAAGIPVLSPAPSVPPVPETTGSAPVAPEPTVRQAMEGAGIALTPKPGEKEPGKKEQAILEALEGCSLRRADAAAVKRRNLKILTAELAGWDVKLGNPLSETDEIRVDIVDILLDRGAKIDSVDNDGWTALMWASWSGLEQVAARLLESGAVVGLADRQGNTALMIAAQRGNSAIVKALLAKGADKAAANKAGMTALKLAETGKALYQAKAAAYDGVIAALK